MRDKKGRFLPKHKCLSIRDPKTGRFLPGNKPSCPRDSKCRFISKKTMEEKHIKYLQTRKEVDAFLSEYGGVM